MALAVTERTSLSPFTLSKYILVGDFSSYLMSHIAQSPLFPQRER